jgi:mono/diheme cytochrome c family protein
MKTKGLCRHVVRLAVVAAVWAATGFLSVSMAEETSYTVVCENGACKVDKPTYIGWRTYHSNCHVCHAQDGVGSSFAPSLVDKLKEIDKERFITVLEDGYTGQIGVMPGWKDNPNVNKRFNELYAYLKARSDGVLGPGKPARIK